MKPTLFCTSEKARKLVDGKPEDTGGFLRFQDVDMQKLAVFEHAFDVQLAAFARRRARPCDLAALRGLGRAAIRCARAQKQACASGRRDHAP